jgi:hypothetical protein
VRAELAGVKPKGVLAPAAIFPFAHAAGLLAESKAAATAAKKGSAAVGHATATPGSLAHLLTACSSTDALAAVCRSLPVALAAALVLEAHSRAQPGYGADPADDDVSEGRSSSRSSGGGGGGGVVYEGGGAGAGALLDLLATAAPAAAAAVLAAAPVASVPALLASMRAEAQAAVRRLLPDEAQAAAAHADLPPPAEPALPARPGTDLGGDRGRGERAEAAEATEVDAVVTAAASAQSHGGRPIWRAPLPPPSVDLVEVCVLYDGEVTQSSLMAVDSRLN